MTTPSSSLLQVVSPVSQEDRVLACIYDRYELATAISFNLFATKNGRDIYSLETLTGRIIVKVLEDVRSVDELSSATEACILAYRAGLPVPDVLKTRRGARYTRFDDRYIYLYRYADGLPLMFNEITAKSVGALLAGLHSLPVTAAITKRQYIVPKMVKIATAKLDQESLDTAQHYTPVVEEVAERADEIAKLPQAIAHGDLSYGNVLLKRQDVAFLIDFDEAGCGPAMFDLAYFIGHVVSFSRETPTIRSGRKVGVSSYASWAAHFMQAYQQVRPLSKSERELLPLLVQFVVVRWHGHLPGPKSHILDTVRQRVESWIS